MRNLKDSLVYKYNALIKGFLKDQGVSLGEEVALAVSGGSDSVFLAYMLLSSKKPLLDKSKTTIIHVNHHWRKESVEDELFVQTLGKDLGVPVKIYNVYPQEGNKESAELIARKQRKEIFKKYPMVLTGHTSDDLFETILWKTLQGRDPENGIKVSHENEVRPLLFLTKQEMQSVLNSLSLSWKEDWTNHDGKLLRSKMRAGIMKVLQKDFPEAQDLVVKKSLKRQRERKNKD